MHFYRLANLLNVDVALGALGSMMLAASVCNASTPFVWFVLLPLAVWATYTLDHVLDGMHLSSISAAPRHQIAKHYARALTVGVVLAIMTLCIGGALLLPGRLFWFSSVIGLSTLAHIWAAYAEWYQAMPPFSKELTVAVLYGAGTWGGPALFMSAPLSLSTFLLSFIFFLTVILNLGLFQWFERLSLLNEQECVAGLRFIDLGFLSLFAAIATAYAVTPTTLTCELLLLTAMGGILCAMRLAPHYFLPHERFRFVGDGVFLLPLLLFLKGLL